MPRRSLILLVIVAAVTTIGTGIYKWVDEKGVTHYTDQSPPERRSNEIKPLPKAAVPAAPAPVKSLDELEREFQKRRVERKKATAGPPPSASSIEQADLASSQQLMTTQTWVTYQMHSDVLAGTIGLAVKAKSENRRDMLMEAWFELPPVGTHDRGLLDNPDPPLVEVVLPNLIRIAPNQVVRIEGPPAEHLRCRRYYVTIMIYSDEARGQLLGEHRQAVCARLNGMKIRTDSALREALRATGECEPR